MILNVETQEKCKKCFHFQVCSSVLKNDLFIREVMLKEKEPKCKSFVEVVHGRWEIVTGSNGKEYMVCTECRKQQTLTGVFSYCPNCGAKMDGDGNG